MVGHVFNLGIYSVSHTHTTQGIGVALTALRQGLIIGATALKRRLLVSVEINNKDRAYEWFLAWMAHQSNVASTGGARSRVVPWIRSHKLSVETTIEQSQNGSSSALFRLVAGPGIHWLRYGGAWMQVRVVD
jgi:chaperone BCS1